MILSDAKVVKLRKLLLEIDAGLTKKRVRPF